MSEWKRVVFADECAAQDWDTDREFLICAGCGGAYEDCPCPGPTMDEMEYKWVGGVMYGRER